MFEHNSKKEILGMIEALLRGRDGPGGLDQDVVISDGKSKAIWKAVPLLVQLNRALLKKEKPGPKGKYEPLAQATAVLLLYKRGDVQTYKVAEEWVSEITGTDIGDIKTYRSRHKQGAEQFSDLLLNNPLLWKAPPTRKRPPNTFCQ